MLKFAISPGLCVLLLFNAGCHRAEELEPAAAAASSSAEKTNARREPSRAETLLAAAIEALDGRESLAARLHLSVSLFGERMVGSGIYLEEAPTRLRHLHLEMNIQMRGHAAYLRQVCDGKSLWTFRKQGDEQSFTRVDVARVLAASVGPAGSAEASTLPRWPGIGGLPRLLRALQSAFQFDVAERGQLLQVPVWRLQGQWRPGRLATLLPEQKAAIDQSNEVDWANLPGQFPTHVVVYLGQEDMVPYRVEYQRRATGLRGLRSGPQLVLALQLSEVSVNAPLDPACFTYPVTTVGSTDATDEFLAATGLK